MPSILVSLREKSTFFEKMRRALNRSALSKSKHHSTRFHDESVTQTCVTIKMRSAAIFSPTQGAKHGRPEASHERTPP